MKKWTKICWQCIITTKPHFVQYTVWQHAGSSEEWFPVSRWFTWALSQKEGNIHYHIQHKSSLYSADICVENCGHRDQSCRLGEFIVNSRTNIANSCNEHTLIKVDYSSIRSHKFLLLKYAVKHFSLNKKPTHNLKPTQTIGIFKISLFQEWKPLCISSGIWPFTHLVSSVQYILILT